jgi:hypothetical protein
MWRLFKPGRYGILDIDLDQRIDGLCFQAFPKLEHEVRDAKTKVV